MKRGGECLISQSFASYVVQCFSQEAVAPKPAIRARPESVNTVDEASLKKTSIVSSKDSRASVRQNAILPYDGELTTGGQKDAPFAARNIGPFSLTRERPAPQSAATFSKENREIDRSDLVATGVASSFIGLLPIFTRHESSVAMNIQLSGGLNMGYMAKNILDGREDIETAMGQTGKSNLPRLANVMDISVKHVESARLKRAKLWMCIIRFPLRPLENSDTKKRIA